MYRKLMIFTLLLIFTAVSPYSNGYAATNTNNPQAKTITWKKCKGNTDFLCSQISVPLDYKNPNTGDIQLPVSMHPANKESYGYLLFNFGGPWADNVKILPSLFKNRLTSLMKNHYNIIVMNPRGVPPNNITCKSKDKKKLKQIKQEMKYIFAQGDVHNASKLYDLAQQKSALCSYNKLSKYASTQNTMQDIEALRRHLNTNKLNLYMDSYASRLGLAYLINNPQHVEYIILDGNIAPSNKLSTLVNGRALGAEQTFNAFFNYCAKAGKQCKLNHLTFEKQPASAKTVIKHFQALLKKLDDQQGIPTSNKYAGRPMSSGMLKNLMYTEMQPSNWQKLASGLYHAITKNNADQLMQIYINNTGYNPASNRYETDNNATRQAVICESYVIPNFSNKKTWLQFIQKTHENYSSTGTIASLWLTPLCIDWHYKSTPLLPDKSKSTFISSMNKPSVLIIGNKTDPMTPYQNSVAVQKYLKKFNINASLLKWNAVGHTALLSDSPLSGCVFRHIDQFLADKSFPSYLQCSDWQNPFFK